MYLKEADFSPKVSLGNTILLVNAFVWYSCVPVVLDRAVETIAFTYNEKLMLYTVGFIGAVISIYLGLR